eukprot:2066871-Amphidinium_carterae.1
MPEDSQHIYFLLEAVLGGSLMDVLRKQPEVLGADSPRGLIAHAFMKQHPLRPRFYQEQQKGYKHYSPNNNYYGT